MDYLSAVVLGIIEGITEFLPISSTGHLLISEYWLGSRSDTFNIVIQSGAILAVTIIYWRRLVDLVLGWRQQANFLYASKILVAFMITAVLGLVAKKLGFALPRTLTPIAWALIIGGIWIIGAEWIAARQQDRTDLSWIAVALVGLAQIVAGIFPGLSRSGATIFVAMLAGTSNRAAATEFAFLVGLPTMYAASAYELYGKFQQVGGQENWIALGIAFISSAITAFVTVKWLLGYIQSHRFTVFAIYRILFGAALLGMAALGWIA